VPYTRYVVRVIAIAILLAVSATACLDGSSSSSRPSDHGGYNGKEGKIYDAAYKGCYQQMKQGPTADLAQLQYNLFTRLNPITPLDHQAFQAGCDAGLGATGVPIIALSTATTP
jgi:hypothetical protein